MRAAERETVERHLNRNVVGQLLHGTFGQTGFRLVQAPTFLPAFLFELSGSDLVVGAARSLQGLGTVVSPVIGASLIGHRPRILGATMVTSTLMRLQVLGLALAGFLLGGGAAVAALLVFLTLLGFFQGMSQVAVNSLRARVIPVRRRGIVNGARHFLAGLTSAAVSYLAGAFLLEQDALGNGYASVFLLAFAVGSLGLAGVAMTKEPTSSTLRPRESPLAALRGIAPLLREDPAFARFFVARALGSAGRMALPFYIVFAATRMDVTGAVLGLVTTVLMLSSSVANLAWGALGDRFGHRIVLIANLALWTAANAYIPFVTSVAELVFFFVLLGIPSGGFNQAAQNMVLEFGRVHDIPLRVAASGTAVNVVAAAGPFLGGVVAAVWSYPALFWLTVALQLVALVIVVLWTPEPRFARDGRSPGGGSAETGTE